MNTAELIAKYNELRALPRAAGEPEIPDLLTVAAKLGPVLEQARLKFDPTSLLALIPILLSVIFPGLPQQFVDLIIQIIKSIIGG